MCSHLIGKDYCLGNAPGTIDCIGLVIAALDDMGIPNPGIKQSWYEMTPLQIGRELRHYTDRISEPKYDGDIALLGSSPIAFGVAWQRGILYINRTTMKVDWKPANMLPILRSYRTKKT